MLKHNERSIFMNTKLKKFLSTTLIAAVVAGFNIQPAMATITSLLWSNNFNSPNPTKWTGTLNPDMGNWECSFWGTNSCVGTAIADDDTTHGKALRFTSTDSANKHHLAWKMPSDVTSGKLLFKFDIKMKSSTGIYFAAQNALTGDDWNPIVHLGDNKINAVDGATPQIGTYNLNQWNKIRVLFDIDNGKVTTYCNGNSTTASKEYRPYMKFILQNGVDVMLDNLHAEMIDTTQSVTAEYFANGNEIGKYIDNDEEGTTLTVEIDGNTFAALPKDIKLTDLGDDRISSDDDTPLTINTALTENSEKINIAIDDYLENGHMYKLNIGNAKDIFGRTVSNKEITFIVAENDGWKKGKSKSEDFSSGTQGDFFKLNGNTYQIISGDNYDGGKALEFSGQVAASMSGLPARQHTGKLNITLKMQSGNWGQWGYDTGDAGSIVVLARPESNGNTPSINFLYPAPAEYGGPTTMWDKYVARNDGMNTINYTIDFDTKKATYSVNGGQSYTNDIPTVTGSSNLEQGIRFFRFVAAGAVGGSGNMIVDSFNWEQEYQPITVDKIAFVDAQGNELEYDETTGIDLDTQIKLYFSDTLKEDTLANISVKSGNTAAAFDGTWNADDNTYTIAFTGDGLAQDTTYALTVPETVTDNSGFGVTSANGTFKTAKASVSVSSVEFVGIDSLASYSGNTVTVKATVKNTYPTAKNVAIVFAGYNGTTLKNATYNSVAVPAGAESVTTEFTLDKTDITKIKAFALTDIGSMQPYCAAAEK